MIEIKKVSKRFDKIEAVSDVSLSIEEGQVFGLLGTNGAGKSTLLRMMAGVLKEDEGEILMGKLYGIVWKRSRSFSIFLMSSIFSQMRHR